MEPESSLPYSQAPATCLYGSRKSRLPPGFDPRNIQPVASRYTDWAIPAHSGYIRLLSI